MDDLFVKISDRPDLAPVVAGWLLKEFGNPSGRTLEEMTAIIAAPRILPEETFVLFEGGQPIGTASIARKDLATREDLTPWLAGVYVESDFRGRGYGTALIRKAEHHVMKASIPTLWLYTWTAEQLYHRLDWKRVGVEIDRGREVVLMKRDIYEYVPTDCPLFEAIAWIAYKDELTARRYSRENAGNESGPQQRAWDLLHFSTVHLPGTERLRAMPLIEHERQMEEWVSAGKTIDELYKRRQSQFDATAKECIAADRRQWSEARAMLLRALREGSIQALDRGDAVGSVFWAERTFSSAGVDRLRYSRDDLQEFVKAAEAKQSSGVPAPAVPKIAKPMPHIAHASQATDRNFRNPRGPRAKKTPVTIQRMILDYVQCPKVLAGEKGEFLATKYGVSRSTAENARIAALTELDRNSDK